MTDEEQVKAKRYITTLRAVYSADDDVEAIYIANQIRENAESELVEDDESVEITQVTSNSLELTPEEICSQLRHARNLLINTRIRQCFDLASELDRTIFALENRREENFDISGYDYGNFMDVVESILTKKEAPDD
jgi:hypothetical protein